MEPNGTLCTTGPSAEISVLMLTLFNYVITWFYRNASLGTDDLTFSLDYPAFLWCYEDPHPLGKLSPPLNFKIKVPHKQPKRVYNAKISWSSMSFSTTWECTRHSLNSKKFCSLILFLDTWDSILKAKKKNGGHIPRSSKCHVCKIKHTEIYIISPYSFSKTFFCLPEVIF